ncbi:MAG TPA: tetratricopeptide repeat protein [Rhizomicrobium sp.]|nr:tetratricopeptide repeat protein [Rhizomicrobium sp.]
MAQEEDDAPDGKSEELIRAQAMIKAKDWSGAERVLAGIANREDEPAATKLFYSRVLLRRGKLADALKVARQAAEEFPRNRRVQAQLANALVKSGKLDEALAKLEEMAEAFPDEAVVHALRAEAAVKAGQAEVALEAIDRADTLNPGDADNTLLKIVILAAAEKPIRVKKTVREAAPDEERLLAYFKDIAGFHAKAGRKDQAFALVKNATDYLPRMVSLRVYYAERLLAANQAKDALAVLDANAVAREEMQKDRALRFAKARAGALQALGKREEAIEECKAALALDAEDEDSLRDLYVLNQQLGRDAEMRAYGKRLSSAGAKAMPKTLAEGLAAIESSRRTEAKLVQAKLDWAWEVADKSKWLREDWLKAVDWGRQADQLLRAWWLNMPDRADEIDALIDRPGANGTVESMPKGARCLMVTTHIGPLAGAVRYMQTLGRPFRGFGFGGPDPVAGEGPPMRIASNRSNPAAALRTLVDEIAKGTVIGFAQDSPDVEGNLRLELLGRTVAISTLVPRLAQKHDAATVWCQARWQGKRMVVETERLPDPEPGEAADAWCRRWCEAYLAKIATTMRGAPENLTLGQGIWVNADESFAARRKALAAAQ